MATLAASKTRIPPDAFNRVVYQGERIRIERHGREAVYLVSEEDAALLEMLEDYLDVQAAKEALKEMIETGETPIPWERVKADLGL